jgi:hypothetical protein
MVFERRLAGVTFAENLTVQEGKVRHSCRQSDKPSGVEMTCTYPSEKKCLQQ